MRALAAILGASILVLGACGTTAPVITRQYTTTSATCLTEATTCQLDGDCCSQWCVNRECRQRQP